MNGYVSGSPPHVGWWLCQTLDSVNSLWRWWDGIHWSVGFEPTDLLPAEIKKDQWQGTATVKWSKFWPINGWPYYRAEPYQTIAGYGVEPRLVPYGWNHTGWRKAKVPLLYGYRRSIRIWSESILKIGTMETVRTYGTHPVLSEYMEFHFDRNVEKYGIQMYTVNERGYGIPLTGQISETPSDCALACSEIRTDISYTDWRKIAASVTTLTLPDGRIVSYD